MQILPRNVSQLHPAIKRMFALSAHVSATCKQAAAARDFALSLKMWFVCWWVKAGDNRGRGTPIDQADKTRFVLRRRLGDWLPKNALLF